MDKKIVLLFLIALAFSCGTKRSVITKKGKSGTSTVAKTTKDKVESTKEEVENKTVKIVKSKRKAKVPAKVFANATERYIDTYKDVAQEEMQLYNIPASITLAQGILESGSGKGRLSVEANNHFGIKCHNWTGVKIYHDDDEAQECFRKYNNAKYSFRDHSLFLTGRKRYQELFKLNPKDYQGWAKGLRAAGYATDKKYPEKLISIIERYELHKYDQLDNSINITPVKKALPRKKVTIPKVQPISKNESTEVVVKEENLAPTATTIIEEAAKETYQNNSNSSVVEETVETYQEASNVITTENQNSQQYNAPTTSQNNTYTSPAAVPSVTKHEVVKGDTLYNISKRYNLTVPQLKALNNLNSNNIYLGQKLRVSKN